MMMNNQARPTPGAQQQPGRQPNRQIVQPQRGPGAAQAPAGGQKKPSHWVVEQPPLKVSAKFRFMYQPNKFVSFNYSDELEVTSETDGWLSGYSLATRQPGLFPTAYTTKKDGLPDPNADLDKLYFNEVNDTLYQWSLLLNDFMNNHRPAQFFDLLQRSRRLIDYRNSLWPEATICVDGEAETEKPVKELSADERKLIRAQMMNEIDSAVSDFGLEVLIRHSNHEIATLLNTGPFSLFNMHMEQAGISLNQEDEESGPAASSLGLSGAGSKGSVRQSVGSSSTGGSRIHQLISSEKSLRGSFRLKSKNARPAISLVQSKKSSEPTAVASSVEQGHGAYFQVWVKLVMVLLDIGSDYELRLSLYSRGQNQPITEEWVGMFSKDMTPKGRSGDITSVKIVFKNVENTEFRGPNDMYLVTRVIRVGSFQDESSLSKSAKSKAGAEQPKFRRPFGAGVTCLNVDEISNEEVETKIDLYTCSDGQFGVLPEMLVNEIADPDIKVATKSKGIIMTTRLFQSNYDDLATSNPLIRESDSVDMLKVTTLVMPGTQRNDAYITLEEGDVTEKNVQIMCCIRRNTEQKGGLNFILSSEDGKTLVDRFYPTVLTSSSPKWRETFKVRPNAEDEKLLPDCHLYFELQHVSSDGKPGKPFAFSFLRLSDKGEIMKEGVHTIPLYKYHHKADVFIPYLDDQSKKEIKSACLKVSARISSTLFTQNETLNRLFNWSSQQGSITDILHRVTYLSSNDIVKHLEMVFKSLFTMLEQNEDKPTVLKQIYDNITLILEMLTESHSAWNFRPAIDEYISKCYKGTCHRPLMSCLQKALEIKPGQEQVHKTYKDITTTTKVLDYVWMIIIQSHLNYTTQNNLKIDADAGFQQSLVEFLGTYRKLLSIQVSTLKPETRGHAVRAIIFAMKHFPTILHGMALFFKPRELCTEIISILQIVCQITVQSTAPDGKTKEAVGTVNETFKITEARLALYASIVSGEFFRTTEMRSMLLPPMCQFMWYQLNKSLENLKALGAAETEVVDPSGMSNVFTPPSEESNVAEKKERIRECLKCVEIIGLIVDTLQIHATLLERKQCVISLLYLLPLVLQFSDYVKKEFAFNPNRHGLASVNFAALQGRGGSDFAGFIESLVGNNQYMQELEYVEGKQEKRRMAALKDDFYVMTVVLALLRVMAPDDWEKFIMNCIQDDYRRAEFCTKLFVYLTRCFGSHSFPKTWGMMVGFEFSTIVKFVRTLEASRWFRTQANTFNLVGVPPDPPTDKQQVEDPQVTNLRIFFEGQKKMWGSYFDMCIKFLQCTALTKDKLSLLFLERYGDLREPVCVVMKRTWKFFSRKFQFFPEVIRCFIQLSDMNHSLIKARALDCYFMALLFEYSLNKNVDTMKNLTMEMLDTERFSDSFGSYFFSELQKKADAEPTLKGSNVFNDTLEDMRIFLSLVHKLEVIPSTDDNLDSRVSAMHDMLDFLKSHGYLDLYVKYLGNMCKLFQSNNNFASLGHALLLHADLYSWDDQTQVPSLAKDPKADLKIWPAKAINAQRACERRENLFVNAAERLEEGQALECAYSVLQEAKQFNMEQEYNLDEIVVILNLQARVAKSIADREGIPPEYYRVGFFGSDVDESIRNKEFIYLARPLEKLVDFQERLEKQYPGCEFLKKTEDPGPDVTDTPGLKILVTPVKPCTMEEADPENAKKPVCIDPEHPTVLPERVDMPKPETSVFLYSKPFRKEPRQKEENEFVGLYLRKLFMYVENPFPSSRCRSVVSKRRVIEVSPLQNATNSVVEKTAELKSLITKYSEHPETNPQPFIMLLNGVICAAVNGGTWMYKEAFLCDEYRTAHPEDSENCDKLLDSIVEQIKTLGAGMDTLDELCHMEQNSSMLGLFEVMQTQLQDTREKWNVSD